MCEEPVALDRRRVADFHGRPRSADEKHYAR